MIFKITMFCKYKTIFDEELECIDVVPRYWLKIYRNLVSRGRRNEI